MKLIDDWPLKAACRTGDPDALFVDGAAQNAAKRICFGCVVRYECLAEALDARIDSGVWGGMTERERRTLLRDHPDVPSWRRLFETAPQPPKTRRQPRAVASGPGRADTRPRRGQELVAR
jgi:WhiB family redox-sensing transcriptional regulator